MMTIINNLVLGVLVCSVSGNNYIKWPVELTGVLYCHTTYHYTYVGLSILKTLCIMECQSMCGYTLQEISYNATCNWEQRSLP